MNLSFNDKLRHNILAISKKNRFLILLKVLNYAAKIQIKWQMTRILGHKVRCVHG